MDITTFLLAFFTAPPTLLIALLILVDFVTGVLSALARRVFAWSLLWGFLPHDVLPGLGCYGLVAALGAFGLQGVLVPVLGATWEQIVTLGAAGTIIATLAASIGTNVREIGAARQAPQT